MPSRQSAAEGMPHRRLTPARWTMLAVAVGAVAIVGWQARSGDPAPLPGRGGAPSIVQMAPAARSQLARTTDATGLQRPGDAVDALWATGSLRGTELDGDWGRWSGDLLLPSVALRRRFDQLLSAQDEVGLPAVRAWIGDQVRTARGEAAVGQVLAVWDRYLQLLQTPFAQRVDPSDPATWQAALSEHSRVRRLLLGSAWAEAFYGDEERAFQAFADGRSTSDAPARTAATADDSVEHALRAPASGLSDDRLQAERSAAFGRDAAERLRANDAEWADWQRRLAAARTDWALIAAAPELSDLQRAQAQQRLLTERFSADEQPRAQALVGPAARE